MDNKFSIFIA